MEENLEVKLVSVSNVRTIEEHVRGENVALNPSEIRENIDENQVGFDDNKRLKLGLRENPKKSWWVSSVSTQEGSLCKHCGKGFKSDKALFGHMRLHTKRKKMKEIVEMPNPTKKKRSERRYNNKIKTCSNNSYLCDMNLADVSCSSVSCCDSVDQELVDIAVCLLMLGNGGFCSLYADQTQTQTLSDDDSVKMDSVESPQINNDLTDNVTEVLESGDLGFGYVSCKEDMAEFHGFDQGFASTSQENPAPRLSFDCLKKPSSDAKAENPALAELHDTEINDRTDGSVLDSLKKPVFNDGIENQTCGICDTQMKDETSDSKVEQNVIKHEHQNSKYICKVCNKIFKSGQSLGGHKMHCPISRRHSPSSASLPSACSEPKTRTETLNHDQKPENASFQHLGSENRVQISGGTEKKKRGRKPNMHKCTICCKSFGSGQALGGHMRAHVNCKLESSEREFAGVDDPAIPVAICGSKQQTVEVSSTISGTIFVGIVAGV